MNKGDEVTINNGELKSKFFNDANNIIPILNKVSSSFCLAKWTQVSLHLTNGMNNSCYHPPLHKINIDDIQKVPSALHNTDYKKEQRKMMLDGVRPKECNYCWAIEDRNELSDRFYRSAEPWSYEKFDEIIKAGATENVNPTYVEVNFNNVCNLKCSYCSPQFSSTWHQFIKQQGPAPTNPIHNDLSYFVGDRKLYLHHEYNPYIEAFWKWWPTLYRNLKHFRMTGGEPLLDNNTYKIFHYVLLNPKSDLHLAVTSNFSQNDNVFKRYLDYVKNICTGNNIEHFMQYVSLDSWGKQAEYIRSGLDFELAWNNVNKYLNDIPYKNSLTFIITMNNLNIFGLKTLLQNILALRKKYSVSYQRVWFDTPFLRNPSWQSLEILPNHYSSVISDCLNYMKENLETEQNRFHGFKDYEIQRLERVLKLMTDVNIQEEKLHSNIANFYRYFDWQDKTEGTNFLNTFPELKEFWNLGSYYAKNQ